MYKKKAAAVNYNEITESIIEFLKQGNLPLGSGWSTGRNKAFPFNLATGNYYRGINILTLWIHEMTGKFTSNGWITLNQMRKIGDKDNHPRLIVLPEDAPNRADNKTGQKAVAVLHADRFIPKEWKMLEEDVFRSEISGEYENRQSVTKSYLKIAGYVFNLDQIENLPEKYQKFETLPSLEEQEPDIATMVKGYGVPIELSPNGQCYYKPSEHKIFLVHPENFDEHEEFLRVKFHEMCHSTGHYTLLGRFKEKYEPPSKQEYAFEELVAEFGAAFVGAAFGLPGQIRHAAYINNYIGVLKKDNKAVFKAAAKAQSAAQLILSYNKIHEKRMSENTKTQIITNTSSKTQFIKKENSQNEYAKSKQTH